MVFRGTQEGADWWTNLKFIHREFPSLGKVHEVCLSICGGREARPDARFPFPFFCVITCVLLFFCSRSLLLVSSRRQRAKYWFCGVFFYFFSQSECRSTCVVSPGLALRAL